MIQIIGHNEIVIELARHLKSIEVDFKVYSNVSLTELKEDFVLIDSKSDLKKRLLRDLKNSIILSAGAPWIFDNDFLNSFEPVGIFNIHGTMLPLDRGGTVISWNILNKKRLGNALIHKMVSSPDAGPVLVYEEFIFPQECYYPIDYIKVYNQQQVKLAKKICEQFACNKLNLSSVSHQPHYLSTYWPRLSSEINSWVDWEMSGEEIDLFIRAFDDPYDGAKTSWRGKTVKLKKAFFQRDNSFHPYQYGIVYRVRQTDNIKYLAIATNGGTLYVQECINDKGESQIKMIKEGDRLISSNVELTNSKRRTVKIKNGFGFQKEK